MSLLILTLIYVSFIGLGLPDGLLGAAWPSMHADMHAEVWMAGILSLLITCGTIVSSLLSDRLTKRFGAGAVTAVSTAMTAAALLGFSLADHYWMLCVCTIPYGLGAGAVDAALNNVVALHFSAKHMSWLHCFWGVGASVGPCIMGACLTGTLGWRGGYTVVMILQAVIAFSLFMSLPLWKRTLKTDRDGEEVVPSSLGFGGVLKIRGVKAVLLAFFCYCAAEMTAMLWSSSYLYLHRGLDEGVAAFLATLFYFGMTAGRFVNGFLAERFSDHRLIRAGALIALGGILLCAVPIDSPVLSIAGLLILGIGCAPIYPCIIHATPAAFGKEHSGAIIGIEMAAAYLGSCVMPPLFGWLSSWIGMWLFPFFLLIFMTALLLLFERVQRRTSSRGGLKR